MVYFLLRLGYFPGVYVIYYVFDRNGGLFPVSIPIATALSNYRPLGKYQNRGVPVAIVDT